MNLNEANQRQTFSKQELHMEIEHADSEVSSSSTGRNANLIGERELTTLDRQPGQPPGPH